MQRRGWAACPARRSGTSGFTLAEVVISMAVAAVTISAIMTGYVISTKRAEWSAYSSAAQSLALQRLEQTRASKWDPNAWPPVDELAATNFPVRVEVLDIPIAGTNLVYATNVTSISVISSSPPLKMIRVDCSWMFLSKGPFTNTVVTYRTSDQ